MLFKNTVRTSKRTPDFTITEISWLTLFKFKHLSVYFNRTSVKWMEAHPGKTIIQFQTSELFGEAYGRTATAVSGFVANGRWLTDPNVFNDSDFANSL
jgi:uncharacterized secreted protein with C-terminal beta-propeller domain